MIWLKRNLIFLRSFCHCFSIKRQEFISCAHYQRILMHHLSIVFSFLSLSFFIGDPFLLNGHKIMARKNYRGAPWNKNQYYSEENLMSRISFSSLFLSNFGCLIQIQILQALLFWKKKKEICQVRSVEEERVKDSDLFNSFSEINWPKLIHKSY